MIYVEALDELKDGIEGKTVFLAGGITTPIGSKKYARYCRIRARYDK